MNNFFAGRELRDNYPVSKFIRSKMSKILWFVFLLTLFHEGRHTERIHSYMLFIEHYIFTTNSLYDFFSVRDERGKQGPQLWRESTLSRNLGKITNVIKKHRFIRSTVSKGSPVGSIYVKCSGQAVKDSALLKWLPDTAEKLWRKATLVPPLTTKLIQNKAREFSNDMKGKGAASVKLLWRKWTYRMISLRFKDCLLTWKQR